MYNMQDINLLIRTHQVGNLNRAGTFSRGRGERAAENSVVKFGNSTEPNHGQKHDLKKKKRDKV